MKLNCFPFIFASSILLFGGVNGVYFYSEGSDPKCFLENLPPATVVVVKFSTEVFSESKNGYFEDAEVVVSANVREKDSTTSFVSQKLGYKGQLTFTTTTLGDHHICFSAGVPAGGWFHNEKIKFNLNFFIGSDAISTQYSSDKVTRVQDMIHVSNLWLQDVLNEQKQQREKEVGFLEQSKSLNSKLFFWIFFELATIVGLGYWQVAHLRRFFVNRKLV